MEDTFSQSELCLIILFVLWLFLNSQKAHISEGQQKDQSLPLSSKEYSVNLMETFLHKLDYGYQCAKMLCYVFRACLHFWTLDRKL